MNGERIGGLLSLAVEDMIEDARYAANLGALEGAKRMVAAYEACRGLDALDLEALSMEGGSSAVRLAASWCLEVWEAVAHLDGCDVGTTRASPGALHKAAELLGLVAPGVRVFPETV